MPTCSKCGKTGKEIITLWSNGKKTAPICGKCFSKACKRLLKMNDEELTALLKSKEKTDVFSKLSE